MECVQRVLFGKKQSFLNLKSAFGTTSYQKGVKAEELVLDYFLSQGYTCKYRRLRTPFGELDLVCSKSNILLFIEVKYRKILTDACWALHFRQKKRNFYASQWVINQIDSGYDTCLMCAAMVSDVCMELYFNTYLEGYDTP
ncbi:hypothetical protein P618_200950 [Holospora obtusa F1]|uniref:Uncharacterized protein n=1 Tax=Holospora obtusa F1 TaxID=1399147 RepID=W6TE32_HOLOB|nr:YraN family protein [Holospora obtusa]ETZ06879.1 hypothetical protein P618_200950 [Holospora obtusa F1]